MLSAALSLAMLVALGLAIHSHRAGRLERPSPERPWNVLLVVVDTLRADHLGSYGYQRNTSPNLDAFARENLLFLEARSQAPCTYPSVNSMLTSRYPARFLGQPGGRMGIPGEVSSLAEMLRLGGYRTLAVSASPIVRRTPTRFNPHGGFEQGFQVFDENCLWREAACVSGRALSLLDAGADPSSPFFLYLHYMDPHGPYRPPDSHRRRFVRPYEGKEFIARGNPLPIAEMLYKGGPDLDLQPRDLEHLVDLYDEEVAYFDAQFGRLLQGLAERRMLQETLVVVASDHGELFLEHDHIKHCRTLFDSEIKTPLLMKIPSVTRPRRLVVRAQNLDIVPTILEYVGLRAAAFGLEGRSLRRGIETGAMANPFAYSSFGTLRAIYDGRFKLILDQRDTSLQLFDLAADPGETQSELAGEPQVLHRLRRELFSWLGRIEGGVASRQNRDLGDETLQRLRALGYLQ